MHRFGGAFLIFYFIFQYKIGTAFAAVPIF
jgi:hypothetical protein